MSKNSSYSTFNTPSLQIGSNTAVNASGGISGNAKIYDYNVNVQHTLPSGHQVYANVGQNNIPGPFQPPKHGTNVGVGIKFNF
jgi:hypothetical protein